MKVRDLIAKLQQYDPNLDVAVYDGGSCVGHLSVQSVHETRITDDDAANIGECEGRVGETVVSLGFGSY